MADAPARFKDLCLDARDHQALADWWCAAMGYVRRDEVAPPEEGWTRPLGLAGADRRPLPGPAR